jgi:hypothetical protein
MPNVMELEFVPKERQHPQLAGTELRPIEDVLNDPEAQVRGLVDEYTEDPDFRAHVAAFEKGYARLLEASPITEKRLQVLIDHQYASDAIERKADFFLSDAWSDPHANFDIEFCTYLDLAMPIDPADRVTPDQARDGKLYWMDHILRQAEHLADRRRYGSEPVQDETPEEVQLRSERLRAKLATATEADRQVKWRDRLTALGGAAAITTVEAVPMPDLGTKAGVVAGAGALGLTGLRWVGRKLSMLELRDGIRDAERDEALKSMLPVISPDVTVSQAIRGLQYEAETLDLADRGGKASMDKIDEELAVDAVLRGLDWARFDDTSVGHLYWLTRDLASHVQDGRTYDFYEKRFQLMAQKLNKYLPIDQAADTVTPEDEFTGEKTWQKFAERVARGDDTVSLDKLNAVYFSRFGEPKSK